MPSDLSEEGQKKLAEIRGKWTDELNNKWDLQDEKNEFIVTDEDNPGQPVRKVQRVIIEVRLQRGDITWVLREVKRVPAGEDQADRVRFSHPQGKVDGSDQELGDEMQWHNAAHRELLEETGFDLHLINENNVRVFPENVNEGAEYVVRSFLSHCHNPPAETNHLGGTFPDITRITETRHYVGQLIEPAGKLIDLSEPIIEEERNENGEIVNRHFFRWFPSTQGFNTDFGEDSAGIQPTHPYDLLDALKQARRIHEGTMSWSKIYNNTKRVVNPDTGESSGVENQRWELDAKFIAKVLDDERKSDSRKAGDLAWGKHSPTMQSKLHLGHRQAAMIRFNKILLRKARDENKRVPPLIPYGQMSREFGLRVLSDSKNAEMMENIGIKEEDHVKLQANVWGKTHGEVEAPNPANMEWGDEDEKGDSKKGKKWRQIHGYIIQALKIKCPSCDGVEPGQPCPQPWATSLHGNYNKTRLAKVASNTKIDSKYLNEIKTILEKDGVKTIGWRNLQPSENGWVSDWKTGFPLICRGRLHTVSQNLKIEDIMNNTLSPTKTQREPKRYLSCKTVSPATMRNRIIHSLQRYILQSRNDNLDRYRILKSDLHHVLRYPIVRLFDTENWGNIVGVDLDNRQKSGVDLNIFDYSTAKRLHKTKNEHEWTVFDVLEPNQNLDGQGKGFLPSVQVDAPLFEIFSAFTQGHPAVVIRRDYYVNKDGEKWPKPMEIPKVDRNDGLEIDDRCITPGQLIQSAAERRTVLMNEEILQVRCALGVLEADTFLHKVLPSLQ